MDLLELFFKSNPNFISKHHLDSYNEFTEKTVQKVIESMNPFPIIKEKVSVYVYVYDVHFTKPKSLPNYCRMNNDTYMSQLMGTIKVVHNNKEQIYPDTFLCNVPVMVHSNLCLLKDLDDKQLTSIGECPYDHGGYFIINGKEKVIVSQEHLVANKLFIADPVDPDHHKFQAFIKCTSDSDSVFPKTLWLYDNIKKVISWTLPTNAGEAMIVIVALLAGFTLPVTPIQILWINLVTGITLGLALAFEPTEKNTMRRPPRPVGEPLLDARLVWHLMLVSLLFLAGVYGIYFYAIDRGSSIELARTLSVNTLVVMDIFHLFFIRNIYGTSLSWKAIRGTRVVWFMVILVTIAQLLLTYTPPLQRVFQTEAVSLADGLIILGIGIVLLVTVETEKQLRLRMSGQHAAVSA